MNYSNTPINLLQAVLEGFVEGIIVLSDQQEVIYTNRVAEVLCAQFSQQPASIPAEVHQVCEVLIESGSLYGDRPVTVELEVPFQDTLFRIRAQWLRLDASERLCILVRLQDQKQAVQGLAIAEAQKWDLTKRETEVWTLRRLGYKRKQIAAELYIAEDTVKKHLKNIQFKRQGILDEESWRTSQAS